MLERQLKIRPLREPHPGREEAAFWRARPAAARLAAVEFLRRQVYGAPTRLLRTARVIRLEER